MALPSMNAFSSVFIGFLLLSINFSKSESAVTATVGGNETDRLALLGFKGGITDTINGVLSSWNNSIHFCNWEGVTCSPTNHQRVMALDLSGRSLLGYLSPHVFNLTYLRLLNLSSNRLYGLIPEEIGRLSQLQYISLRNNSLGGEIPANITSCFELQQINLDINQIVGKLPEQLGFLPKLRELTIGKNNITGNIPSTLGNLSSLVTLYLSVNALEGSIPDSVGQISGLQIFMVAVNKLSGTIPNSLYNLSSMVVFDVTQNQLHGRIPSEIGISFPNLEELYLSLNSFAGPLPLSLSNASRLQVLSAAANNFTGVVPSNLGNLEHLQDIFLNSNELGTDEGDDFRVITSLTNCTKLQKLNLFNNSLAGELPNSIANLSAQLTQLYLGHNQMFGTIPVGIENLVSLIILAFRDNLLTGTIPDSIGKLTNLQVLRLYNNRFSGHIPSSIGNITGLVELDLSVNNLQGNIPLTLESCPHLDALDLSQNNLSGPVPMLTVAVEFYLYQNSLSGSLEAATNNLKKLQMLDVSKNKLSGEIPTSIGNCESLEYLYMGSNLFQGSIPPSLSKLQSIIRLDLSHNNLSGQIPEYLAKFQYLESLNLSYNHLDGEVPQEGIFQNTTAISLLGNNLCGGLPSLYMPPCPEPAIKKKGKLRVLQAKFIVVIVVLISFCISVALCWAIKSRKKHQLVSLAEDQGFRISYVDLVKATDQFSPENLIGRGGYSHVYKGRLDHIDEVVAVKVFNLQHRSNSKVFEAECKALRNIRHRNLVKIITACSSIDLGGNEFRALVFKYVPNGSLEDWLHPVAGESHQLRNLSLAHRVNIAIDVASALDYLHNHCQPQMAHCDLKPSNILLDDDMIAYVGDFGLSRFLYDSIQSETNSLGLKGTIGYVAPEYGMGGKASTHGDVFSFGILLLEMFTGKSPTDELFRDNLTLHVFAAKALNGQVNEIIDPSLLLTNVDIVGDLERFESVKAKMFECLVSIINIGILCSQESPLARLEMKDVVNELLKIKDMLSWGRDP